MAKLLNSNLEAIFIGNPPATGFHNYSYDQGGNLAFSGVNSFSYTPPDKRFNMLLPVARATDYSYSFDISRENFTYLGKQSLVSQPIINLQPVNLQFSYFQNGIYNERIMGFLVDFPNFYTDTGNSLNIPWAARTSGLPFFNRNVCPISGFLNKDTDYRNIFIAERIDGNDFNSNFDIVIPSNVMGFGNCYITSYQAEASVGSFPRAAVSYVCDNIKYYTGVGYGFDLNEDAYLNKSPYIPALLPRSGSNITGQTFLIPPNPTNSGFLSVIRPGDISISIYSSGYSTTSHQENAGFSLENKLIQSYSLQIDLNRENLQSLGYVLPVDRRINLPVFANINFDLLIDNLKSGELLSIVNYDIPTNIYIDLRNRCGNTGIAIKYQFLGAKLVSENIAQAANSRKTATLAYLVEMDPLNTGMGFFISGVTNLSYEPISGLY